MGSLNAFLHPVQAQNKKVVVSKRFVEDGKPVEWEIKPITQEENKVLLRKYSKTDKKGNETFDRQEYISALTAISVVYPDLKNAELQKAYNALGEIDLMQKMLLLGEYAELAMAVQSLSDLDTDINGDIEEVKNA